MILQYGYVMVCQMTGPNEVDGNITCKLMNDVMAPYFTNTSATEMRKLIQEDKQKADKFANECGANALSELKHLSTCHLRLSHSRDVFFGETKDKQLDGADALLELFYREEL